MTRSQNGWPAEGVPTHRWVIPAKNGTFELTLRNGSAGFLLAHLALWYSEVIEDVTGRILDDWGYASRLVRGSETVVSNHQSGTAMDLNALAHQLAKRGTYTPRQVRQIQSRLRWMRGVIGWGGNYVHRADEMHFEIVQGLAACEREARRLMRTPRGRRILKANPTQKKVIVS